MTFTFNDGDTSSVTSATIYASTPITISQIIFNGVNTSTSARNVTLTLRDGTTTYTETISVPAEDDFTIAFNTDFTSVESATITIAISRGSGVTVYGGTTRTNEKVLAGMGAYISSSSMYNCTVTMTAAAIWRTSEYGYMELTNNPLTPMWEDFERDEQGYALTAMVWKLDSNNDGYPWMFGYTKRYPTGGGKIYINTETGLRAAQVYLNTENGLVAAAMNLYVNTADGLRPISIV